MKNRTSIVKSLILGLLTLLVSGSALADWSWNFTGSYGGNSNGMTFSGSGGAPTVTATAWSNSVSASSGSSNYGTGNLVKRDIARWSGGLGVYSSEDGGSPTHATDNNKRIDAILLDFGGTAVTLDQVKLGWYYGDSDISLAAYTGGGSTDLSSMEYSDLTSNGWTTIGSYYDVQYDTTSVNDGEVASSFWLISALNPYLGGTSNTNYYGNDYFKLKTIAGLAPPPPPPGTSVPEPSTLLLLGGALLIMTMRARKAGGNDSGLALQA